jgi:hypothetical protein
MTHIEAEVLSAERTWFDGLLGARVPQLEALLTQDFQIIDVSSGAEADRATVEVRVAPSRTALCSLLFVFQLVRVAVEVRGI